MRQHRPRTRPRRWSGSKRRHRHRHARAESRRQDSWCDQRDFGGRSVSAHSASRRTPPRCWRAPCRAIPESSQAMNSLGETLRGRVPLRLFDGIPQSTPLRDGSRNSAFTDMDIVGRIEVINGPSAAEGIGAAGGIINYISKDATEPGPNFNVFTNLSLAVRGRQRQLESRRHAHAQVRGLRPGAERLARRSRHHLRRERPPHRPEREQLLGGLRDREPVREGRHELRRRRQSAAAVLRQPFQAGQQGRLSLGPGQPRAAAFPIRPSRGRRSAPAACRWSAPSSTSSSSTCSRTRTSTCSAAASPPTRTTPTRRCASRPTTAPTGRIR